MAVRAASLMGPGGCTAVAMFALQYNYGRNPVLLRVRHTPDGPEPQTPLEAELGLAGQCVASRESPLRVWLPPPLLGRLGPGLRLVSVWQPHSFSGAQTRR